MSNPFENPINKNQPDSYGFKEALKADFTLSYQKAAFTSMNRLTAIEAGNPIKKGDESKKSFYEREVGDYIKALTGKSKEALVDEYKDYKVPELSELVKKDSKSGKLLYNINGVEKYKWATALSPLTEKGVRDFRNAKQFDVELSSSGKAHFKTDSGNEYERIGYDIGKLGVAFMAENEDGDKEFTILPYAHINDDRGIGSKSLIVLNQEQREKVRRFITEKI